MKLHDIGIMLIPSFRAFAYLQKLIKNGLHPGYALILKNQNENCLEKISKQNELHFFDKFDDFKITLGKYGIDFQELDAPDCNDGKVIEALKKRPERYFIFTGGGILKKEIFDLGKQFIHVHPGLIPQYRGSTCMYYSIINDDNCGATGFFMSTAIDTGDILGQRIFAKPSILNIDYEYDAYMRSELLVQIIKDYAETGQFNSKPQNADKGEMYFVIHPVLKHLAILNCI